MVTLADSCLHTLNVVMKISAQAVIPVGKFRDFWLYVIELKDIMQVFSAQSVILVGSFQNFYLCVMELVDIMQSFLPREVVELFEVVKIDDKQSEWRMDVYLDERKFVPEQLDNLSVIAYGFVEAVTIQGFPIRGKRVYLYLCRRK